MSDGRKLVKTFSKIARASNDDMVDIVIGYVLSVSPLKISIGEDLVLTESFLIQSKFIQEKIITAVSPYNSTSFNIKLWDGVKVGDKVRMIRCYSGQKYYVMEVLNE